MKAELKCVLNFSNHLTFLLTFSHTHKHTLPLKIKPEMFLSRCFGSLRPHLEEMTSHWESIWGFWVAGWWSWSCHPLCRPYWAKSPEKRPGRRFRTAAPDPDSSDDPNPTPFHLQVTNKHSDPVWSNQGMRKNQGISFVFLTEVSVQLMMGVP